MLALVLENRGVNKKVEKSYYFLEEIESLHKVSISDLLHFGANDRLPIYALADSWSAQAYVLDGGGSRWVLVSKEVINLSGPVRLYSDTLRTLEAGNRAVFAKVGEWLCPEHPEPDDRLVEYRLEEGGISTENCKLVVLGRDISRLLDRRESNAQDLTTKERNSLLVIVAALCVEHGYPLDEPHKAAVAIQKLCELRGTPLSENTVATYLKAARELLEARRRKLS